MSTSVIDAAVVALLADWAHHTRTELSAAVLAVGGSEYSWTSSINRLRKRGFYVAYSHARGTYAHVTMSQDTSAASAAALLMRAIPELTTRIKAHRGEMIRAIHQRGEDPTPYRADIGLLINALMSMGLAAGRDPSALVDATKLTAAQEAAIKAE